MYLKDDEKRHEMKKEPYQDTDKFGRRTNQNRNAMRKPQCSENKNGESSVLSNASLSMSIPFFG